MGMDLALEADEGAERCCEPDRATQLVGKLSRVDPIRSIPGLGAAWSQWFFAGPSSEDAPAGLAVVPLRIYGR